jgi:hypothetical protein
MSTPPSPPRRRRRWLVIPLVLLLLFVAAIGWTYVRGTHGSSEAKDPTEPGQPVRQLYQNDGKICVRAAILLPYPRSKVWAAVTDYPRYDQFLPYLDDIAVEAREDGCHMTGGARSIVSGYWPFTIDIHEHKGDREWTAQWDEVPDETILVNRGKWTLIDRSGKEDQTLLVLTLETEVKGYPTFLLRNVFLHRLPLVLRSVELRLQKEAQQ